MLQAYLVDPWKDINSHFGVPNVWQSPFPQCVSTFEAAPLLSYESLVLLHSQGLLWLLVPLLLPGSGTLPFLLPPKAPGCSSTPPPSAQAWAVKRKRGLLFSMTKLRRYHSLYLLKSKARSTQKQVYTGILTQMYIERVIS